MRIVLSYGRFRIGVLAAAIAMSSIACAARAQDRPRNDYMYEVFVRSFASSKPNSVGDLQGLRARLDYLNDGDPRTNGDLNVGILWLMPTFPTRSYHGYDVVDYRSVNPEYGTLADMRDLIEAAHQRGMRVILDIPFNHTSRECAWFKEAIDNAGSPKRTWYFIKPDDGKAENGWRTTTNSQGVRLKYFGLFGGNMPDLNFDNPDVREEVKAIAKFWLSRGIDGFRLDAAKHLYGSNFSPSDAELDQNSEYWREFSDYVYAINPNAILMGEVLGREHELIRSARGLNDLVDEPFMKAARKQVEKPQAGFVERYKKFLELANAENPKHRFDSFIYLSSHDENPRMMSELEKNVPANELDGRYRLAMCMLMSMSARPLIYQGDEIMQRGWKWNGQDGSGVWDETLREPLPWFTNNSGIGQTRWQPANKPNFLPKFEKPNDGISVQEQTADPGSILNLMRALGTLRRDHPTFANGKLGRIFNDSAEWCVFERGEESDAKTKAEGGPYLVLLNLTPQPMNYQFIPEWHPEYRNAKVVFINEPQSKSWRADPNPKTTITGDVVVPAFGMVVLKK